MREIIASNLANYNLQMGWWSTLMYFLMEHYENLAGMLLSFGVAVFSILKIRQEWIAVRRREQREQERHEQEMRQDEERFRKNNQ